MGQGLERVSPRTRARPPTAARRARRKFLRFFPRGFQDETYVDWERGYKWQAHERWQQQLGESEYRSLLRAGRFAEIVKRAVAIESRTNLLFSFEKMALRDAVRTPRGARRFAEALYAFLYRSDGGAEAFDRWVEALADLPRKQTRVLTWPLATVFGFLAQPDRHFFLKPNVTRAAARAYGLDLPYHSRPRGDLYAGLLGLARGVQRDLRDLRPRDLIDVQSFLWVLGSDEYD
jgi:hypothetical protein